MLRHPVRITCLLIALSSLNQLSAAEETTDRDDPVAEIAAYIPATWKVNLGGWSRGAIIYIETDQMDTVPSATSGATHRTEKANVRISFYVLPKYSPEMLKRIRDHNEPILARLNKLRDWRHPPKGGTYALA